MKKEEAEKRWCPWARVTLYGATGDNAAAAVNRLLYENQSDTRDKAKLWPWNCACITDRCMAWESFPEVEDGNEGYCNLMQR